MVNVETRISSEEPKSANEFYSQCEKRDPGGVLHCFLPLFLIRDDLKNQMLSEEQYRVKMEAAFITRLQEWNDENPDHLITDSDIYWLAFIARYIGLADIMGVKLLNWMLTHYEHDVLDNVDKVRKIGKFPASLKEGINPLPDEENIISEQLNTAYLALLLNPQRLNFPPGHKLWKLLGVNNSGEWNRLGAEKILILFDKFEHVSKVFIEAADKAYKNKGIRSKDRVKYVDNFIGIDGESRETLNEIDEIETKLLYEQVCRIINDKTDQLCLAVYLDGTRATLKEAYQNNIKTCQEAGLNSPEAITMRIKRFADRYPLLRS